MDSVTHAQSIVGTGKAREKNDFYPTPTEATDALLKNWNFDIETPIWECGGKDSCTKLLYSFI